MSYSVCDIIAVTVHTAQKNSNHGSEMSVESMKERKLKRLAAMMDTQFKLSNVTAQLLIMLLVYWSARPRVLSKSCFRRFWHIGRYPERSVCIGLNPLILTLCRSMGYEVSVIHMTL